ncbi:hypothetical protein GCM10009557_76170 [Virgisporangium ochraceum]
MTEIVVAAIGWQYHLINDLGLTVLVLVALATTAMTGPLMTVLGGPAAAGSAGGPPREATVTPPAAPAAPASRPPPAAVSSGR